MKKTMGQVCRWIYAILFLLLVLTNNTTIAYAICVLTVVALLSKSISIELAFMISLVLGSELTCIIQLFICIVFLLSKKSINRGKTNRKLTICVFVIVISSLINMVISGAVFNTIFGIIYYAVVIFIAKLFDEVFDEDKILDSIKYLLKIELLAGLTIILKSRDFFPGDIHKGTFPNAHFFTFWLICVLVWMYLYYKVKNYSLLRIIKVNAIWYLIGVFLIVMADGKNVLAGLVLAVLVYGFSYVFSKKTKNRVILSIVLLYVGIFFLILFLHLEFVKEFINNHYPYIGLYLYNSMFAYKFQYFEGTIFKELYGLRAIFGYGIGQYGSRFANLFGYNSMYREDNFINNFVASNFNSFILPNYEKYASLFSKELASSIQWRSAVLSYPFSSVIAFLAENGLFGLSLMTYIWGKWANKSKYGVLVVFLFTSCIFDIYFDHISIVTLILLLVSTGTNHMNGITNGSQMKYRKM